MNYGEKILEVEENIKLQKPEDYQQLVSILKINEVGDQKNSDLKKICQKLGFILLPASSLLDLRDFFAKNIEDGKISKKLNILEFCDFLEICKLLNIQLHIDKNIIRDYYVEMTGDKNPESFENWYNNHIIWGQTSKQRVDQGKGEDIIRDMVGVAMGNFS